MAPPPSGHQITNPNLSSDDDGGNNPANAQEEQQNGNEPQSQRSSSEPNPNPQQPESEVDAQQQRQLLSKVIELENKANINAKREVVFTNIFFDSFSNSIMFIFKGGDESPAVGDRGQEL